MQLTTTRQSTCCGQTGTGQAGCGGSAGVLERPRYFPRQLITPDELTLEADYFRDRMRRHNVYLHGWGVVCGALVCVVPATQQPTTGKPTARASAAGSVVPAANANATVPATEPWLVCVEPGYVLGPYGDEIVIDCAREVPLRGNGVSGCPGGSADDLSDPWCSEVYVNERANPVYIAVRYQQCQVRPVLAQPAGCGCDDLPCEYSRFRDGYEIGILDHCPASHQRTDATQQDGAVQNNPDCPQCPDDPWVVLAEVTVDANGTITKIDNCACRRIVSSTRDAWGRCGGTDHDYPPSKGTTQDMRTGAGETTQDQQAGANNQAETVAANNQAETVAANNQAETVARPARARAGRARPRKAGGENT